MCVDCKNSICNLIAYTIRVKYLLLLVNKKSMLLSLYISLVMSAGTAAFPVDKMCSGNSKATQRDQQGLQAFYKIMARRNKPKPQKQYEQRVNFFMFGIGSAQRPHTNN